MAKKKKEDRSIRYLEPEPSEGKPWPESSEHHMDKSDDEIEIPDAEESKDGENAVNQEERENRKSYSEEDKELQTVTKLKPEQDDFAGTQLG